MTFQVTHSDNFAPQLSVLGSNLNLLNVAGRPVDCSGLTWITPLSILPLSAVIFEQGIQVVGTSSYLNTIHFPDGIDAPGKIIQQKSYIPIVRFPTTSGVVSEKVTTAFINLVLSNIGFGKLITNAFHYAVDEMVTNICEHSESRYGWLFAQYYPTKGYLDAVLLDTGQGLKASYEAAFSRSFSDELAIQQALNGISTKNSYERGFGLRTTRKLVTQSAFSGKFLIISGGKGYFSDRSRELFFDLETWHWNGAIIVLRLHRVSETIILSDYVE